MRIAWLLVAALLVGSCSYGRMPFKIVSGKQFPVDAARQLKIGASDAEVRSQLGPPHRISSENGREVWHYAFETTAKEDIKLLWVVPWPAKERGGKYTATLAFSDHALSNVAVTPIP